MPGVLNAGNRNDESCGSMGGNEGYGGRERGPALGIPQDADQGPGNNHDQNVMKKLSM